MKPCDNLSPMYLDNNPFQKIGSLFLHIALHSNDTFLLLFYTDYVQGAEAHLVFAISKLESHTSKPQSRAYAKLLKLITYLRRCAQAKHQTYP